MRLDIVIPAHNEEHRIGRMLTAYRAGCPHPATRFHVALDQCTDETAEVVRSHQRVDGRVRLHEYPKLGKGGVITETFRRSDGELVGFVDADGATPPAELLRLADVASSPDAAGAIASRNHPASVLPVTRSRTRRLTSAGFAFGVRRLLKLPYRDTQCGAKVLRGEVARDVVRHTTARDLLFDVDLLVTARELGHRVVEVPTVWVDQEGSRVDPIADSRRMGASLLRLWAASVLRRSRGIVHAA